ncbi:MAG: SusC/RagA family TonB-linked outer membrane protein, partial [Flavisolibacter sp.]
MKLTVFLLAACFLEASATGYAQTVSFSGRNVPLKKVFTAIKSQTGYVFFYDAALLKEARPVTVELREAPLSTALAEVFKDQPFTWVIENRTITLVEKQEKGHVPNAALTIMPSPFQVRGTVKDVNGTALAGASVLVKGSSQGTTTDINGGYSMEAGDENSVLIFSMVGYITQTVPVKGRHTIDIVMAVELKQQDEVVVVGYGTANRKDLTGAVSSISGEELNKTPNALFDASLTGRAPGVQVVKSSGAPGAVAAIRIRGGTSAIGNNEPLYVIDGVPIEAGDGFGNAAYQNDYRYKMPPISNINPEDIESIDILKDASSAAIYGSRAANGVVIITTKHGKKSGGTAINFGYSSSFDRFANYKYSMLNADEYHQVVKEAYTNAGTALPPNYIAYNGANTDWVDLTTRTAASNNLYLNVGGGTKDGTTLYSLSGGLTKQNGVIRFTDFERRNLRTSLETTLFGKLRFGTKINYSATENSGSGTGQFYTIMKYRPDVPLYDSVGNFGASPDSVNSNPFARISQISEISNQGMLMSFFGEIEVFKGLKFRSTISSNQNKGTNVRYTPSTDVFEIRNGRKGSRNDYIYSSSSTIFDNTLTYDHRFNQHTVNLLGGASFTKVNNEFTSLSSTNFQDDDVLNNLGSAGSIQTYSSGGGVSGLSSYFLRSNYNYKSRYYITFTGRADHSTKFGPENRWGFFPSGALAWKVSNEDFMRELSSVDELKLRVSYGKTGSANFSDFQYATFFGSGSFYNGYNGVIANTIPNPDIRWESTYQLDVAADFSLFKNKLYGSL